MSKALGINPLHSEPNYIMYGPGAGVSDIVHRETRQPIPPDEPILLLRATDPAAEKAVRAYADYLQADDPRRAKKLRQVAERMSGYRRENTRG